MSDGRVAIRYETGHYPYGFRVRSLLWKERLEPAPLREDAIRARGSICAWPRRVDEFDSLDGRERQTRCHPIRGGEQPTSARFRPFVLRVLRNFQLRRLGSESQLTAAAAIPAEVPSVPRPSPSKPYSSSATLKFTLFAAFCISL